MDLSSIGLVVAAKQDVGRDVLRDVLRRCGIRDVQMFSSCAELVSALKARSRRWDVLIIDGALAGALDAVRELRALVGPERKVLMLFSGPTREEVLEAAQAGANDFIAVPFTQALVEEKLSKVMGFQKKKTFDASSMFRRRI